MKLLICGFMGAGKSTLLSRLEDSGAEFKLYELDFEIESREGLSISKIFELHGEEYFRKLEKSILLELLDRSEESVISLGGGTLEHCIGEVKGCRSALVVWLNTPFDECWERIAGCSERPLVRKGREALYELFQKRSLTYSECDIELPSGDISLDELLGEIKKYKN